MPLVRCQGVCDGGDVAAWVWFGWSSVVWLVGLVVRGLGWFTNPLFCYADTSSTWTSSLNSITSFNHRSIMRIHVRGYMP